MFTCIEYFSLFCAYSLFWVVNRLTSHAIFQNGKQMVQEGALTALASVADSSQVTVRLGVDAFFCYFA
jgi:hypothetical protein